MSVVSIVGAQWGDEGKGKITDLLAQTSDVIVRYQGGNNAGHSIKFDGKEYSLHIMPSGIFNSKSTVVIAGGVVLNPKVLLKEIKMLKDNGFDVNNLIISDRVNIILPYHEIMDELIEENKIFDKVGTTKKGIGPCYSDKMTREGIRFCEFVNDELFKRKLEYNVADKNKKFATYGYDIVSADEIFAEYKEYARELKKYMGDTSLFLENAIQSNKKVLFEGAQGVMLDIEHGTYPYVTSSSPASASIPYYCGISPAYLDKNIGIVKAYTSRVGEGPFPTKIGGDIEEHIVKVGREFGTTTGRKRKVGWLDLAQLKYSIRISGINKIAFMLLDVLDEVTEIKVCVGYKLDGEIINTIPALESEYSRVEPIYEKLNGWISDTTKCSSYDELPKEAKEYIKFVENNVGVNVAIVSTGPDRKNTIMIEEI